MRGKIFEYNSETKSGLIVSEDGATYTFIFEEYQSYSDPIPDGEVDFLVDESNAIEIYPLHDEVEPHVTTKKSSRGSTVWMKLSLIVAIGVLLAVLVYSELERHNMKELQNVYHAQIEKIKEYVNEGNCDEAFSEYTHARETRKSVGELGLYYSIEPFAVQAHAIDIAECYAQSNNFENATNILDAEEVKSGEYQRKASEIYTKAGENEKARVAQLKAEKFDHGE